MAYGSASAYTDASPSTQEAGGHGGHGGHGGRLDWLLARIEETHVFVARTHSRRGPGEWPRGVFGGETVGWNGWNGWAVLLLCYCGDSVTQSSTERTASYWTLYWTLYCNYRHSVYCIPSTRTKPCVCRLVCVIDEGSETLIHLGDILALAGGWWVVLAGRREHTHTHTPQPCIEGSFL